MADSGRERDYERPGGGTGVPLDQRDGGPSASALSPGDRGTVPREHANYETSGLLAKESNTFNGVVLKWHEPLDAKLPEERWRLYVFKDGHPLEDPFHVHRQSAYLFGRDRRVADIPVDHPSCSSQHAVLQFRLTEKREDGVKTQRVRPYIMDLGSTNCTYLNSEKVEPQRYVELFERDVIKFGYSSREYVLLHDKSATK